MLLIDQIQSSHRLKLCFKYIHPQYVEVALQAYLLHSVCQLITHKGHQFGERWPVAGIQGPALTHHPVPGEEESHGERRWDIHRFCNSSSIWKHLMSLRILSYLWYLYVKGRCTAVVVCSWRTEVEGLRSQIIYLTESADTTIKILNYQ